MAMGEKPVTSRKETEGKKQRECFHSEDLECRSKNLSAALVHKQALRKREHKDRQKKSQGRIADAVKLSSEFLASIIVGIVLGVGFDKLAGSWPWGLVFFLFLGFAAGVLSILRSVGYVSSSQLGQKGVLRQDEQNKGTNERSDK
ncbi:AtpZ/AtpI family protein [Bartonella tribocorum]|uniref:ATP synthase protein I n=1 Tax=Bartonella tribocorum (strain DSM 28219 / CCUG 45778 / CIP 105476 / IBS 506) TaxID=382640 RepID=A9IQH7_BART1|nr:AtpZ/AtpI family protein [Bartonella tribocorum]CAK01059.1 ATP synthase protein I [Bartonella tribocorum CIP 105476]CDO48271.1 ATP synthase protein I [Bartonella tribocorum]